MTCQRNFLYAPGIGLILKFLICINRTVYQIRYITSVILMKTPGLKLK